MIDRLVGVLDEHKLSYISISCTFRKDIGPLMCGTSAYGPCSDAGALTCYLYLNPKAS